ncbi:hypothetical protein BHE74_00006082 [Ensete ventricosum]|nr:hypothetical protein BHE74_00006082 [Ensete ventricosum]
MGLCRGSMGCVKVKSRSGIPLLAEKATEPRSVSRSNHGFLGKASEAMVAGGVSGVRKWHKRRLFSIRVFL